MTAEPMLGLAALTGLVDISIDAHAMRRQGLRSRPAPDLLLAVCRRLHIDPAAAVSLTHSGPGVIAALEIDMPVIGVAAGPEAHGLHELGAGTVVPTLGALLDPSLRAS